MSKPKRKPITRKRKGDTVSAYQQLQGDLRIQIPDYAAQADKVIDNLTKIGFIGTAPEPPTVPELTLKKLNELEPAIRANYLGSRREHRDLQTLIWGNWVVTTILLIAVLIKVLCL